MSKNNKNAKRNAAAKEISKARQNNGPGAKSTTPNHKKKNAWWQKFRTYGEFVKGGKKPPRREEVAETNEPLVTINVPK